MLAMNTSASAITVITGASHLPARSMSTRESEMFQKLHNRKLPCCSFQKAEKIYCCGRSSDTLAQAYWYSYIFPERMKNKVGNPVLINQVGWAGIILGRIDVFFEKNKKGTCITCKNLLVGPSS